MTRLLIACLALAAATPSVAAERRYSVTDFDRLVVEGPYIVRLVTGGPSTAVATGSQAALDRVTIDVSGQTLRIRRNRSAWGGNPGAQAGPVEIELGTRTLRSARLIGPAALDVEGMEGLRVDLIVEGSGRLRASRVDADNLSLGPAGSGRIEVSGTAETLNADIQGTGDVEGSGLVVEQARIITATIGRIMLAVEGEAEVAAYGLGSVEISGDADCTVTGPNAGLVRCGSD